jgi:hypothetical protein
MTGRLGWIGVATACVLSVAAAAEPADPAAKRPVALAGRATVATPTASMSPTEQQALVTRYCVGCHNDRTRAGRFTLEALDIAHADEHADQWEKVVRKLRAGLMPPVGSPRPDESTYDAFLGSLEGGLDRAAAAHPNPGRTPTFHRLNRTEYHNAVRDLLSLDLDVTSYLPPDDSSYGFDNMAGVLKISRSLMERYLSAAKTISRLAVGTTPAAVVADVFPVEPDLQQHERLNDLPFGTRGGTLVHYLFPSDAEYEIRVDLLGVAGLRHEERLEVSIDGDQARIFSLGRKSADTGMRYEPESKVSIRVPIKAGPHDITATFYKDPVWLLERAREPFLNPRVSGQDGEGGLGGPLAFVTAVAVTGPFNVSGPGDTPSRQRVFACYPASASDEPVCARRILTALARRAYRRAVTEDDLMPLLKFFTDGRSEGGDFDSGIETALRRLLVSPEFLFRIESDPTVRGAARTPARIDESGPANYRISAVDLASRLSFFLWSSIPDDELLDAAVTGRLRDWHVLETQVRRMIADPKAESLTQNFAAQWLQLRNLASVRPGDPYSLNFDETLRQGFRRETELFVDSVIRENRSVMELLTARYTFLNERVARHYGIPNVQGSHFRRVDLPEDSPRRGLLGQGSILTLTSQAIRTSPVFRGKWILLNILGTPPPDPPPNVPALVDRRTQQRAQTMRERMAQHRANPVCSACHSMIDPAGFALENFDAVGRWREVDESFNRIDASGALPDGTKFNGVTELRAALARRPVRFVKTVTEKLLTYALGRGLEYYDMPAVRKIVRDSAATDYSFQSVILGVVNSYPFQMRRAAPRAAGVTAANR